MKKKEIFFRIKALIDGQWVQSITEYPTHKDAKRAAEAALYAPYEYKIVRCERSVIS